jgi:hypothetical protein
MRFMKRSIGVQCGLDPIAFFNSGVKDDNASNATAWLPDLPLRTGSGWEFSVCFPVSFAGRDGSNIWWCLQSLLYGAELRWQRSLPGICVAARKILEKNFHITR